MSAETYPLFHAAGSPRELGRMHGEQAKDRICRFLDYLQASLQLSRASLRRRAERFEPLFRRYCPHLLEEVAGLAEGAGLHPLDALAAQLRGELAGVTDEACTTFVVRRENTANGGTLIGQNSDTPAELMDYAYVLRLVPERGPRILMWTFGGMIGYHGMNEHGVAHFANALGGGPAWRFALSHYPLKRMMLEQRNLADVRRLLREVPVCSNGNYVLCDGAGAIADVELTADGPHEVPDDGLGFLAHSNHYVCGAHACAENFARSLPDSFPRLRRMQELLQSRLGRLTVDDLKKFLSDHEGYPTGICRHPHSGPDDPVLPSSGRTVASLIAEPDLGLLHVSRGNPCEAAYATYRLGD
ncbi:MAG: C45 family autoproteolytic acyltransferase/hydrolase [Deltaproteobacteria bacterium]